MVYLVLPNGLLTLWFSILVGDASVFIKVREDVAAEHEVHVGTADAVERLALLHTLQDGYRLVGKPCHHAVDAVLITLDIFTEFVHLVVIFICQVQKLQQKILPAC